MCDIEPFITNIAKRIKKKSGSCLSNKSLNIDDFSIGYYSALSYALQVMISEANKLGYLKETEAKKKLSLLKVERF